MLTFLQAHRRVSTLALLAALALGGCGRTTSTSPITQVASPEVPSPPVAVAAAAPPAASPQLPPPPTPATFDVAALAEQVKPMVVNITITHEVTSRLGDGPDPFEFFFGPRGGRAAPDRPQKQTALGTGFIIDASGYVVTNEHVVREADEVRVRLADEPWT